MPDLPSDETAPIAIGTPLDQFVEIGLLLPKYQATALLEIARDRGETVGQILRKIVEEALHANILY